MIRKVLAEFRRVAVKDGLVSVSDVNHMGFLRLADLVLGHLNELCGFPPEKGLTAGWVQSREGMIVVELETNYNWWIPAERLDEVIDVVKEHFDLPKDAKPKWYLENDIDEREQDEYLLPSELLALYGNAANFLTTFLSGSF